MSSVPKFFVPAATEEDQERIFAELAAFAAKMAGHVPVPLPRDRIFSITYRHDGEIWTSTVGEMSRGIRRTTRGKGSSRREVESRLEDPAIVLAIFEGDPYAIVTNEGIGGKRTGTTWANPFIMGLSSIKDVTRFSPSTDD